MLTVTDFIGIADSEFTLTYSRSGGPGGQNVNKVNSRALLQWDVTRSPSIPEDVRQRFLKTYPRRITKEGIVLVSSQRYRDQAKNAADCLEKLRELLLTVAVAPTVRKKSRPTRGSQQRRLSEKKAASERKQGRRRPNMGD